MHSLMPSYQKSRLNTIAPFYNPDNYWDTPKTDALPPPVVAALAGAAVAPLVSMSKSLYSSMGYDVKGINANFRYTKAPVKTEIITVTQELKITLRHGLFTNRVYFKVISTTDGFSILDTSIKFLPGKSDTMVPDSFNLGFRAIKLSSNTRSELRLKLQFTGGRYNPAGFGDYDFGGSLIVSAKTGKAVLTGIENNPSVVSVSLHTLTPSNLTQLIKLREQQIYSTRAQQQGPQQQMPAVTTQTPRQLTTRPNTRRRQTPSISRLVSNTGIEIYFGINSSRLSRATQQAIIDWFVGLPRSSIVRLRNGTNPVYLTGYASSDGSLSYNLRLSRRRANSVANFLRNHLGTKLNIQIAARGEIFPNGTQRSPEMQRMVKLIIR